MNISIAILTHNEGTDYLSNLCNYLVKYNPYEVVIVDDYSTDQNTIEFLNKFSNLGFKVVQHQLNSDFAQQKNFLTEQCTGEYILNLDADEFIEESLWSVLPSILMENSDIDVFALPRLNVVSNIKQEYIDKWGWWITDVPDTTISTESVYYWPAICWPDYQTRLYKNIPSIRWKHKVHETLSGHKTITKFPTDLFYAIRHIKQLDRQIKQNEKYEQMVRNNV